jgi:hypothetical protein
VLWWNFSTARCQFFAAPSGKTIQRFFPFNPLTSRKKDAKNCIAGDLTRRAHLHGINKPVYASLLFSSKQKRVSCCRSCGVFIYFSGCISRENCNTLLYKFKTCIFMHKKMLVERICKNVASPGILLLVAGVIYPHLLRKPQKPKK